MSGTANPAAFGARGTFAMIAIGFAAFIGLLVWLGTGEPQGNNGGAQAQGKGITGYAALAAMLALDGSQVGFNRVPDHAGGDELLILTPLSSADTKAMAKLVQSRRNGIGPTIVVTPKWYAMPLTSDPRAPKGGWFGPPRAPRGWTTIVGAGTPQWPGFLDKLTVALGRDKDAPAHGWRSGGASGALPDDHVVLSGGGADDAGAPLVPLVRSGDGRILAGYFADGGAYPDLEAIAGVTAKPADEASDAATDRQPLVVVFEPDLLNNRGMADAATARNARRLLLAAAGRRVPRIVFDLSLAGLGASKNLLTLAFTPPYLAATICLIFAMAGVLWRGFARFGPAQAGEAGLPPGKLALVSGGATLLLRARRHHLLAVPYADAVRDRLVRALGLPRRLSGAATDAAIAHIQHTLSPGATPFGDVAASLIAATGPAAIALHAAELHRIEQTLLPAKRNEGS